MPKCVVLCGAGIDTAALLLHVLEAGYQVVPVHILLQGSAPGLAEFEAIRAIQNVREITKIRDQKGEELSLEFEKTSDQASRTFLLAQIGCAFAQKHGAVKVFMGGTREDTIRYSNLRTAVSALRTMASLSHGIHTEFPFLDKTKKELGVLLRTHSIPFSLLKSCERHYEPCGVCPGCVDNASIAGDFHELS